MPHRENLWFRLGHAYERARREAPARRPDRGEARAPRRKAPEAPTPVDWPSADDLIAAGSMFVLDRLIGAGRRRRAPGFVRLLRAAASGAAAALIVDLLRPALEGRAELPVLDRGTGDRLLVGVGQGLVYGALVEPNLPGPAVVKGALFGSVEYAVDPMGGLSTLLAPHTPQGRLPVVSSLLDAWDAHDRAYLEHLAFGVALAILYDSGPASNGIAPDTGDTDDA